MMEEQIHRISHLGDQSMNRPPAVGRLRRDAAEGISVSQSSCRRVHATAATRCVILCNRTRRFGSVVSG
jgi:hypothetical protein